MCDHGREGFRRYATWRLTYCKYNGISYQTGPKETQIGPLTRKHPLSERPRRRGLMTSIPRRGPRSRPSSWTRTNAIQNLGFPRVQEPRPSSRHESAVIEIGRVRRNPDLTQITPSPTVVISRPGSTARQKALSHLQIGAILILFGRRLHTPRMP